MTEGNRYAPPGSPVADINTAENSVRDDYGLKLSASLFWRVLVLQTVLAMPVVIWFAMSDLGESATLLKLKPSLIYIILVAAVGSSLLVFRPGLLFLVWGSRLNLSTSNWRRFSWSYCGLYLVLAITNAVVAVVAPVALWMQFKIFAGFFGVIALCLVAPRFLVRPKNSP